MKKKQLMIVSVLALGSSLAAMTTTARADEAVGPYAGASIGRAHDRSDSPVAPTDRNDTNYKLYGGYGFTPNFGVELGYADLGHFGTANGSLRANAIFADAVGTFPLASQWSAIGRVGVFDGRLKNDDNMNGNSKDTGANLKVGAGLQYDLSKGVALRGEWEHYKLNTSAGKPDIDTYSIGVNYRF